MPIIAKTSFGVSLIANPQRNGWVHVTLMMLGGARRVPMYARLFSTGVAILPFAAPGYTRVEGVITEHVYNELCKAAELERRVLKGCPNPEMAGQTPIHIAAAVFAAIDGESDEA